MSLSIQYSQVFVLFLFYVTVIVADLDELSGSKILFFYPDPKNVPVPVERNFFLKVIRYRICTDLDLDPPNTDISLLVPGIQYL